MTYQKKYYFQFKDLLERLHVVELWHNTEAVISAEEVKSIPAPFVVEMPEIDHKFQVVRGTGCVINLLSDTDMKFFTGLYHVNPTDFMVKHYIDSVINWLGYLNAEMMTEQYDIDFNYQVSVTGNDGFSLMDRFSFVSTFDGSNFAGIASKFGLLEIIFAKIGLLFTEYRIALSTTFAVYSGAIDKTILHESFIDCANFYDEDNKPMSLREVVESILAPYGANIRAEGGNIYITDIHTLASFSSVAYKRFSATTGAYAGLIVIPNVKTIASIGYRGTGQSIERSGGVNRQVVSYSPYPTKTILDQLLVVLDEFVTVPGIWSTKNGFKYKTLIGNKYWNVYSPATFEASYNDDPYVYESEAQLYLRYPRYGGLNTMIASLRETKWISITGASRGVINGRFGYIRGVALRINGEVLVKTKNNPYDKNEVGKNISRIGIKMRLKCGLKYYSGNDLGWVDAPSFFYGSVIKSEVISDTFNELTDLIINIGNLTEDIVLNGNLEFEIWSEYRTQLITDFANYITNSEYVKEIWIKNISISWINVNGSEITDSDTDYIGLLDKTFQNEGEKITLTCGTDTQFADRGKIMKFITPNYSNVTEWTRAGQSFKIEELLLGSLSSNYRAGFITLMNMKLKNTFALQNILTDSFTGTAKLMLKSANINYHDNVTECSLVEISPDELIIVK